MSTGAGSSGDVQPKRQRKEEAESQPVVHTSVAVLEVDTPELMRRIEALVDLDPFVLCRISEREVVLEPGRGEELSAILEPHGLAPVVRKAR